MVYISAGHSPFSSRKDFGAEGCNYKEALLAIELRDLICKELDFFKVRYVKDLDTETLGQYLERIKTGNVYFFIYNKTLSMKSTYEYM